MKVVKSKENTITMNELKEKFTNYIIAADLLDYTSKTIYVLIYIEKKFKWVNLETNRLFEEQHNGFEKALEIIGIEKINVFKTHTEFADWLKSKEEEFNKERE